MIERVPSVCKKALQYQMEGPRKRWPTKMRRRPPSERRVWQWRRRKNERAKRVSLAAAVYHLLNSFDWGLSEAIYY